MYSKFYTLCNEQSNHYIKTICVATYTVVEGLSGVDVKRAPGRGRFLLLGSLAV